MSGRATLILIAAALLAGAYVFSVDRPRESQRLAREAREQKLVPFDREDIRELELPLPGEAGTVRVVRAEDFEGWRLEGPIEGRADTFAIDGLLTALVALEPELEVEEPPDDRAGFGFDPPRRVSVTPEEGPPISISLGGDAPVGELRYVEVSTRPGTVLGVRRGGLAALEPPLLLLRDKSMIRLDPADVTEIEVETAQGLRVALEKVVEDENTPPPDGDARFTGEAAWRLRAPIEDQADAARVSRLIQDFYFARADDIIDSPESPAAYGLDAPAARLRFATGSGESEEIALGKTEDGYYARVDAGGPVFDAPARLLQGLPETVFDYRFKRVLSIRRPEVFSVRLSFPRESRGYLFVEDDREGWRVSPDASPSDSESPGAAEPLDPSTGEALAVEPYHVDDLIQAAEFIRARDVVEDADLDALGLVPPTVRIRFMREEGTEIGWLELGALDPGVGVPARSSVSSRTWLLPDALGEKIPLDHQAFEDTWLSSEDGAPEDEDSEQEDGPGDPEDLPAPVPSG